MITKIHMSLDISGGIKNAKMLKGCITVDGKTLQTVGEIRTYLNYQLSLGRRVLPCGECNNFDYQKGCLGHRVEESEEATNEMQK